MFETNSQNINQDWEIKKIWRKDFYFFLIRIINDILIALGLRRKRKFWGVVYDSVSKQPLDPVIVKLIYAKHQEPVETCITDMRGRYGFLVHPGKFKILATKSNYTFPAKMVSGSKDGIFENIYHGEFIELLGGPEVLAPNIPMDPVGTDWNQQAKQAIVKTSPYGSYFINSLIVILFWFGLAFILLFCVQDFVSTQSLTSLNLRILLFCYIFLLIFKIVTPEVRLWGFLENKFNDFEKQDVSLVLLNASFKTIVMGKSEVKPDGRFLLRASPGKYILKALIKKSDGEFESIGEIPVRVHGEGVFNSTLRILKK